MCLESGNISAILQEKEIVKIVGYALGCNANLKPTISEVLIVRISWCCRRMEEKGFEVIDKHTQQHP